MAYAKTIEIDLGYEEAVDAVKAAFAQQGFGTLTEIDVAATLRAKLGEEMDPCLIIGACNPALAHRALSAEPDVAVLLPCNVVVRAKDGHCVVSAMDPGIMSGLTSNPTVGDVAGEADRRVQAALDALAAEHAVSRNSA